MTFGASGDVSGIPPSEPEERMTRLMQRAWAVFCEDPANGLSRGSVRWPRFNPARRSLIRLAVDNRPGADFVDPGLYDTDCGNVTLGALATPTSSP